MKVLKSSIILWCMFLLSPFYANADSFSSSERQWAVWHYTSIDMPHYTITYGYCGDSLIDDKNYKKVWSAEKQDLCDATLEDFLIREADGKIYMRRGSQKEWMFFDCTCKVGDTLCLTQGSNDSAYYVYAFIKNVQDSIFDNIESEKHKYWKMNLGMRDYATGDIFIIGEEIFFENIGFSASGYAPTKFGATGGETKLLCMHSGDSLIYMSTDGVCYKSSTTAIKHHYDYNVSLTQRDGECVVTLPCSDAWSATLYNSVGAVVARRLGEGSEIVLPTTSKGTHILVLNIGGRVVKKKVSIK